MPKTDALPTSQVTIFWADSKKTEDGEPMPPVTQDAVHFAVNGAMFQVIDTNGMMYLVKIEDIDVVSVVLPTDEAPEAPGDTPEEKPTPLIELPRPER